MSTLKIVKISDLILAGFNPKARMTNVKKLAKSIAEIGLLVPPLVTKKNEVCDGHRRIAACILLGLTEIPVLVASGEQAKIFAHANTYTRRLNGNETLSVYLSEPDAIGPVALLKMQQAEEMLGRKLLRRLEQNGLSLYTFTTAKRIAEAAGRLNCETIQSLVEWLIEHQCTGTVHKALQVGATPKVIFECVKKNKPLVLKHAVGT